MKAAIGVDGGVSGAIAFLDSEDRLRVQDVPTVARKVGAKERRVLCPETYIQVLRDWYHSFVSSQRPDRIEAFLERGGDIPFVGPDGRRRHQAHMYDYGFHNGQMLMGMVAMGFARHIVEPQTWKRHFHLLGKDKEASRERASELYPAYAFNWKNKGHHNRAEAVLIARFGLETM